MDWMIFPKRLKDLRIEKKLSAKRLAKEIGVSDMAIIRWERGEQVPGIDNLYKIAEYFKVSTDFLVGRNNDYS